MADKKDTGVKDPYGTKRLLAGGLLIIGSLFLLVPGINSASAIVYGNSPEDPTAAILVVTGGGAVLLAGLVLALAGQLRRRSYRKRVVSYGDASGPADPADEDHDWSGRRITAGKVERHLRRVHRHYR
ncbi:hypothetical protein [Arthrobacter monumenti]